MAWRDSLDALALVSYCCCPMLMTHSDQKTPRNSWITTVGSLFINSLLTNVFEAISYFLLRNSWIRVLQWVHFLNRIVLTNFFNLFSFTVARESPKFRLKWMTQAKLEIVRVAVRLEVYTLIKGFVNLCSLGVEWEQQSVITLWGIKRWVAILLLDGWVAMGATLV
jgi:hypothetical protein